MFPQKFNDSQAKNVRKSMQATGTEQMMALRQQATWKFKLKNSARMAGAEWARRMWEADGEEGGPDHGASQVRVSMLDLTAHTVGCH